MKSSARIRLAAVMAIGCAVHGLLAATVETQTVRLSHSRMSAISSGQTEWGMG